MTNPAKEEATQAKGAKRGGKSNVPRPASAYRKVFNMKTFQDEFVETDEPELYVRGNIAPQPEQIRPKKKVVINQRDAAEAKAMEDAQAEKEHTELVPREVINTDDGTMIQNYEVNFGPEEELVMAAGVRGIRALRI